MIKLQDMDKAVRLKAKDAIKLESDKRRVLRLEVNCPSMTRFEASNSVDGEITFLANVLGRETIEFIGYGTTVVHVVGKEDIFFWTPEMEAVSTIIEDAEIYTTIATRAARNPELERMMYIMQQNIETRMRATMDEDQARREREERIHAANEIKSPAVSADAGDNVAGKTTDAKQSDLKAGEGDKGDDGDGKEQGGAAAGQSAKA